jgi:hypothetical protein
MDGSAPSETEKETAHRTGAGNVETPATLGITPHFERGERTNRMIVRAWTDWNPIRKHHGTSCLKNGAAGEVGE